MEEKRDTRKRRVLRWGLCAAAVLAVTLLLPLVPGQLAGNDYAVARAVYPESPVYPMEMDYVMANGEFDYESWAKEYDAWREWRQEFRSGLPEQWPESLAVFSSVSMLELLGESTGENRICSPLNLYMALSMLAEVTDGETREQVMTLLGEEELADLRQQAENLWRATYIDDGLVRRRLTNSLWLNEQIPYNNSTLSAVAENYYASSFSGPMGTDEMDQALQNWLNEETGGLLEEPVASIKTKPQTVLALLSTVNFYAQWNEEFQEEATEEGEFTNADGTVTTCDFLRQTMSRTYVAGEEFAAISLPFENGAGSMLLMLPDAGYTPEELLADEEAMAMLQHGVDALEEKSVFVEVDLSLPKFDVNSDLDLEDSLKQLGVIDAFSETDANFAPLVVEEFTDPIFLSQAEHAARVSIDEKGCTAASYVVMMMEAGAAMPTEQVEMKIDRPFLFTISGVDGLPLFAGIVNRL